VLPLRDLRVHRRQERQQHQRDALQQAFILTFLLMTMVLTAGAALVLCFLHWKAQRVVPRLPHQKTQRLNPGPLHQKYSMRVSTTLLLAAMALTLGFFSNVLSPSQHGGPHGQQQVGADCTSVWVNTGSHVYHFEGTSSHGRSFYGNTSQGAYMCEADARAAGNRAAFDEHHR
jgi:hypothetical protein